MRHPHFIAPNKATTFPTKIIVFDCETTATPVQGGQQHDLRLGVACFWRRRSNGEKDTKEWLTFRSDQQFWEWVETRCKSGYTIVLTSHNLGFDMLILHAFLWLPSLGWDLKGFYCKGLTTICRFKKGNKRLRFVDNTNFFRGKLADLAGLVGMEKGHVDFQGVDDAELEVYCKQDVSIVLALWEKWLDFLQVHDLGKWCWTLPSQALSSYRHRFMRYGILVHSSEQALELERHSYHGGRTEVLRVGEFTGGPFYKLDVNSMYPYVMQGGLYPTRLYRYRPKGSVSHLRKLLDRYLVVAECLVETDHPRYPQYLNGWTCYPTGVFRGCFTTEELKLLLAHGKIHNVYRIAYYQGQPIFKEYVAFFYRLKQQYGQEDNRVFRSICKGFLNYLYGKFGQRGFEDKIVGTCPLDWMKTEEHYDWEEQEWVDLVYLCGQVLERRKRGESYNSFPAVAAHVTANARLHLHHLITVGKRTNVFYVDTDSLIVNQEGFENLKHLISDTRLGGLKLEGITDYLHIRAPKDYSFGKHVFIKGIRANATELADGVFLQDKFPGLQGLLRKGDCSTYVVEEVTKHLAREIHSGNITTGGFVSPFQLGAPLLSAS